MGIVQLGRHYPDASLSATLVPTGEQLRLFQDRNAYSSGCRLDVGQLTGVGERIAKTIDEGADILIVNRFGRQEREGQGMHGGTSCRPARSNLRQPDHLTVCEIFK